MKRPKYFKCFICHRTVARGSLVIVEKGFFKYCMVKTCKAEACKKIAAKGLDKKND